MTGSDSDAVAGGPARHIPVLGRRIVAWLGVRDGGLYVDATFGAGGYTQAILATPGTRVIGIDRDQSAIARGAAWSSRPKAGSSWSRTASPIWKQSSAARPPSTASCSMSASRPCRSTMPRADFRFVSMGRSTCAWAVTARARPTSLRAPVSATLDRIIAILGEERHARAVARAIVKARGERAIVSTRALAEIVARVVHSRDSAIHPATRTFQALRIFVNDELGELARGLAAAERVLKPSGRLVVVAFHSLEDRIVKTFLTERSRAPAGSRHRPELVSAAPSFRVLTRRPETPDEAEIAANPRARSAKLRAAERTDAPPHSAAIDHLLPRLPSPTDIMRGRP